MEQANGDPREPGRWTTVVHLLRERAEEMGDRLAYTFLVDGEAEARLTYAELDARARAVGAALQEAGAGGERALLLLPPGLDFVAAFFGCLYGGAVAVPALPPRRRGADPRLGAILADARPRVVLTTRDLRTALETLAGGMPELRAVRWLAVEDLGADCAGAWREPAADASSLAFLQYTSGSTAAPRGVMVTHGNLLANEELIRRAFGQSSGSVVVGWLPLYHDMGLIGNVLQPLYVGAPCHLMSPLAFLQRPVRWLEAVSRLRATTSGGPNFAYELCVRKVTAAERERLDLSSWRVAFNGAEPVRADTLRRFADCFAPCGFRAAAFHPCYGLAEATLLVSGGPAGGGARTRALSAPALEEGRVEEAAPEEPRRRELVGCGEPLQTVLVVDPQGRTPCSEGGIGEVWVAGPSVAQGYWGRPEETAETFGARLADGGGPFLRTGDLGFLSGGELFLAGRIKDLIILRGRNHYPQDLELTAERSHPGLRPGGGAAFAVEEGGEERLVIVHELVRHPRAGAEEIAAALRRAVAEEHGVSVADVVFLLPEALPRTSSGKVRRRACREAYLAGSLGEIGRSTLDGTPAEQDGWAATLDPGSLAGLGPADRRQALESFLRERAAGVLHLPASRVPADRALTALGLDSLSAVELKAGVEAALGIEVPLADLLGGLGAADLAARLAEALGSPGAGPGPLPPLVRAEGGEPPLSAGQKALWFLHRLAPASAAYNLAGAARLPAETDAAALRRALQDLVDRHDALRATFAPGSGGPTQRIQPRVEVSFACEDASGWSDEALRRRLQEEAFRPFDLERGPVLRAALFTRPEGGRFVLAVHHIAADFWSLAVLASELGTLYDHHAAGRTDDPGLPPLELRFADWARWQDQALAGPWGDRLWDWWRERLAGVPFLDLPTDRPRPPAQTFRGGVRRMRFEPAVADGLRALARQGGTTSFVALLAGFSALLARASSQDDFVVGTPTAGRMQDRCGDRLAGLVGYFVNPIPLRVDLSGDPTTGEILARTRERALAAFAHQDLPFPLLAERLHPQRDPGRPSLMQAMLTFQRAPAPDLQGLAAFALGEPGVRLDLGGLRLKSVALEPPAVPLDLTLMAAELEGTLAASLQLSADLFDAATADRLLVHLHNLLGGMAAEPGRRVSELPILSAAECAQLAAWNDTGTGAAWDLERPLHAWIEEAAARSPQATAVDAEEASLTYRELLDRSGRLARHLRGLGIGPDALVGLAAERSPEMVVGLLGILRAGAAYVPLDPEYPAERLAFMLEDSGVRVLLTQERLRAALPAGGAATLVTLDAGAPWEAGPAPERPEGAVHPDGLAYMIYTSGSTGRPKGAMNTHRGIVNRLLWMQETFALTPADRVLQKTPASFDVSVWELFWPLMVGARLVLARPGGHQDPAYLARRIQAAGVTTLHFVPSMLQAFLEEPAAAGCASLRRVIASGEALSGELARRFQERLGGRGAELFNLYGPTEAAVDVTWWPAAGETGARPVPIGRPVANTRIHLLDPHGVEVPVGHPGELCIGGVQLARGYWRRPELTAERFVPDACGGGAGARLYRTGDLARRLADGTLEFLGRLDHQVKLRGLRIELGEIEAALAACPEVRDAVVGARGEGTALRLVAWVTPAAGRREVSVPALREALRRRLPEPMVPSAVLVLPALPLSPSGKVDRRALPDPDGSRSATEVPYVAPRTPMEETLAAIWRDLLKIERVGVDDHFFDLGGHSLLATQLISRVREVFRVEVPLSALFEKAPTVANLAQTVARYQVRMAEEDDIVSALLELDGLSDEEVRALLESDEA